MSIALYVCNLDDYCRIIVTGFLFATLEKNGVKLVNISDASTQVPDFLFISKAVIQTIGSKEKIIALA